MDRDGNTLLRRIKNRLMYSYAGIAAGGAAVLAVLQLISAAVGRGLLTTHGICGVFVLLSAAAALFLAVSGVSLIRHEGLRAGNLMGMALGAAWTAGNLLFFLLERPLAGAGPLWTAAKLALCCLDLFLSGTILMGFLAAKHKPAYDKDYAIIPGCSISKKGGLLPLLKGRTNRAIRFAWDQERASGKPVRYIPTGGQGPDEVISEGSAMALNLLSHGAEDYEILPEKASVNTFENLLFSKKLMDGETPEAKVCFVTTNYHVLRTGILAGRVGLDAEGLASGTKWYFWPNGFAREVVAILSLYPAQHLAAAGLCILAAFLAGSGI